MGIIAWIVVGLIAGFVARWLVPGPDPMGLVGTLALGAVGSLVGGFLGNLIFDFDFGIERAGLIGSVIGGVITLFAYRRYQAKNAAAKNTAGSGLVG